MEHSVSKFLFDLERWIEHAEKLLERLVPNNDACGLPYMHVLKGISPEEVHDGVYISPYFDLVYKLNPDVIFGEAVVVTQYGDPICVFGRKLFGPDRETSLKFPKIRYPIDSFDTNMIFRRAPSMIVWDEIFWYGDDERSSAVVSDKEIVRSGHSVWQVPYSLEAITDPEWRQFQME